MALANKKVDVDIDGDGTPDVKVTLKEIILVIGGIISLVMTYTTLQAEIEEAKKLPPHEDHSKIDQQMKFLENKLESIEKQHDRRLDNLENKVYK